MRFVLGMALVFGAVVMFMFNGMPRLVSDFRHTREFVPAQHFKITNYKCTNWNGFMFNECTTTFVSQATHESRDITDWRFGRAPHDRVQLMQWRDDASSVTTNVSLQTLWNRVLLALALVSLAMFFVIGLVVKTFKNDAPLSGNYSRPSS